MQKICEIYNNILKIIITTLFLIKHIVIILVAIN